MLDDVEISPLEPCIDLRYGSSHYVSLWVQLQLNRLKERNVFV
jgi:hypothetical protein